MVTHGVIFFIFFDGNRTDIELQLCICRGAYVTTLHHLVKNARYVGFPPAGPSRLFTQIMRSRYRLFLRPAYHDALHQLP